MNNQQKVYKTIKSALNQACVDIGFNPFLSGNMPEKRPTIAALNRLGYVVDRKEWKRQQTEEYKRSHCKDCGCEIDTHNPWQKNCNFSLGTPKNEGEGFCEKCWEGNLLNMCDNGHHWKSKLGEECPHCGECAV